MKAAGDPTECQWLVLRNSIPECGGEGEGDGGRRASEIPSMDNVFPTEAATMDDGMS